MKRASARGCSRWRRRAAPSRRLPARGSASPSPAAPHGRVRGVRRACPRRERDALPHGPQIQGDMGRSGEIRGDRGPATRRRPQTASSPRPAGRVRAGSWEGRGRPAARLLAATAKRREALAAEPQRAWSGKGKGAAGALGAERRERLRRPASMQAHDWRRYLLCGWMCRPCWKSVAAKSVCPHRHSSTPHACSVATLAPLSCSERRKA